jgi:hypothetical protein
MLLAFFATICSANIVFAEVQIPKDWPRMKPGYIEAQMNMNGMQQTMHMCMTKDQIEEAESDAAKQNDCTIDKANRKGNQFFVDMTCKNPESGKPMKMTSVSTLVSDSESQTKAVATEGGKTVMKIETKLKRMRACSKEEEASSKRMAAGNPSVDDMMEQYKDVLGGDNADKLKDLMKNMKIGE